MDSNNSSAEVAKSLLGSILQSDQSDNNILYNIFNYKVAQLIKSIIWRYAKKAVDVLFELNDDQDEREIFDYYDVSSEDDLKRKIVEILNRDDFLDEKSLAGYAILQDFARIDAKYALVDHEETYFVADLLDDKNLPIAINQKMAKLVMDAIENNVEEK